MDELIGLTPKDEAILARMVAEYEAGAFTRKPQTPPNRTQRVYEAVPFINATSPNVLIPAYAVMRLTTATTVDGEMVINVAKPDATYRWRYLINGPDEVEASTTARGWGTWIFDTDKVLYDTGSTPAVGERWGPKADEWKLFQHRPGFIVDGRKDSTAGWMYAQQAIPGEVRVKNDDGGGTLAAGAGGRDFGIYGGAAGTTDLGLKVTPTNGSSTAWLTDKYGFATADAGGVIWGAPHQQ